LKVVCNTSPLILLAKIHRLGLLAQLYGEVIVPASVLEEMEAKPGNEVEQVRTLLQSRGFRLQRATERTLDEIPPDLGAGEREAIALALEVMADLVVLDDQQGRHVARERGLPHLIEAGMWIDEAFYHRILQEFGE